MAMFLVAYLAISFWFALAVLALAAIAVVVIAVRRKPQAPESLPWWDNAAEEVERFKRLSEQ